MAILLALHVLAVVVWVGGMFFAYMALRPIAAQQLEPAQRLPLWRGVFGKFFPWVWLSIGLIAGTGYALIFGYFGGMQNVGLHIHLMNGLGFLMMLIYFHVFFAPYRRLKQALENHDLTEAGRRLNQIRILIGLNLALGLIVIAIAAAGRYL